MAGSALSRLKKAANLEPTKRTVTLSDGSEFVLYATPLTMAELRNEVADADLQALMLAVIQNPEEEATDMKRAEKGAK